MEPPGYWNRDNFLLIHEHGDFHRSQQHKKKKPPKTQCHFPHLLGGPLPTSRNLTNPIWPTQSFHSITTLFTYSILNSAHNSWLQYLLNLTTFKDHIFNEISLDDRCYVNNTLYSSPLTHVETWRWPGEKAETCCLSNKFSLHHLTSCVDSTTYPILLWIINSLYCDTVQYQRLLYRLYSECC